MSTKTPRGLGPGGRALWKSITAEHDDLDPSQIVQLEEACRAKDRCDEFDSIIRGKGVLDLMRFRIPHAFDGDKTTVEVKFDQVIAQANATANLLKQLLAALRLPDPQSGKRPQYRGPRGAVKPQVAGGKVSSLERARAKTGA